MYTTVINWNVVHLEIRLLALRLSSKLNEGVAKGITRSFVSNNLAGLNFTKARENEFEILVSRYLVQLAHEQNVFRGFHVSIWQISQLHQQS